MKRVGIEMVDAFVRLYQDGEFVAVIAERYSVSRTEVYRELRRRLPVPPGSATHQARVPKFDPLKRASKAEAQRYADHVLWLEEVDGWESLS